MSGMTISTLAKHGDVGVETVRYYQRRGLMDQPERPERAVRRYGEGDVQRLRFIRAAQTAGFTLEEVAELLALDAVDDRPRAREIAAARIAALDAKIEIMTAARNSLARLAQTCADAGAGPCPILMAFEPATSGRGGGRTPGGVDPDPERPR